MARKPRNVTVRLTGKTRVHFDTEGGQMTSVDLPRGMKLNLPIDWIYGEVPDEEINTYELLATEHDVDRLDETCACGALLNGIVRVHHCNEKPQPVIHFNADENGGPGYNATQADEGEKPQAMIFSKQAIAFLEKHEEVNNAFNKACPQCGHSDQIDVDAIVRVRLTPNGTDADASEDGTHEWDDSHEATCAHCYHSAPIGTFDLDNLAPDDEPETVANQTQNTKTNNSKS